MADIIKTWPAFFSRSKLSRVFNHKWVRFYFSLGRGKPKRPIEHVWFCHRGLVVGAFRVEEIVQNDGSLPKLRSLQNRESEWQFKHDVWVMVCHPPIEWLEEEIFHESFRGWRYFDLEAYRKTAGARMNI